MKISKWKVSISYRIAMLQNVLDDIVAVLIEQELLSVL